MSLLVRNLMRSMLKVDGAEGACRQTNATSAVDLATGPFSARPEEERAGDEEVVEDVVDEEEARMLEMVEEDQVRYSLLLWLSRGQKRLGLCSNQTPTLPQGPVAVTRETSCALSWLARTAAGAVGRFGAS